MRTVYCSRFDADAAAGGVGEECPQFAAADDVTDGVLRHSVADDHGDALVQGPARRSHLAIPT